MNDELLDEFMMDFLVIIEGLEAISKKYKPRITERDLTSEQKERYKPILDRFNKVMDELE